MKNTCKYLDSLNKYCHKPHQCCSIILHQAIKRETTGRLHIEFFFNVFVLLIWKSYQKFKRLPPVKTICFINGMYIKICFFDYMQENKKHKQQKLFCTLFNFKSTLFKLIRQGSLGTYLWYTFYRQDNASGPGHNSRNRQYRHRVRKLCTIS